MGRLRQIDLLPRITGFLCLNEELAMSLPVWIVVANGSRARLLQRDRPGDPLFEVMDWVHPETRQHTDMQEGEHRTSGIQGRSGLAKRQTVKGHERTQFAQEICRWLDKGVLSHHIGAVAVFASNPFLGELLAQGNGSLQKHLHASHALDLTSLSLPELDHRLQRDYRL